MDTTVKRGDIYYADLSPVVGSEQGGFRPVLVVQNDVGNKYSPTVIVAAITSRMKRAKMPTHVPVRMESGRLPKNSIVMLEQIRTIDKVRLVNFVGQVTNESALLIDRASLISLGIDIYKTYHSIYH